MKSLIAATLASVLTLAASLSHAQITNSGYDPRHEALITKAVFKACGVSFGKIELTSKNVTKDVVDQGVIDTYYTSNLKMVVKIDQGVRDIYSIVVQSAMYAGYDHGAQDWGMYSVESATCELKN